MGAIVGRVSNRIRGAQFSINDKLILLEKNDGENIVHSGPTCLSNVNNSSNKIID